MLLKTSSALTSWRRAAWSTRACVVLSLVAILLLVLHFNALLPPHYGSAADSPAVAAASLHSSLVHQPSPPSTFCSHKAYLPSSHRNSIAPSFPPSAGSVSLFASPVLLSSISAFLSSGVTCFDIDVFSTADSVLMVGHPTDTQLFLHAGRPAAPVSVAASATGLYVETLLASTIRALDPLSYIMTLDELLAALPLVQSATGASVDFVTVEPKGKLNSATGIDAIVSRLNQPAHASVRSRINLLVSVSATAASLRRSHPWLQTGLPLRDVGVAEGSSADVVCDARRPLAERLAALQPYTWLWPSDKSVMRCGRVADGGEDLIQRVRRDGKRVGTWVVDEPAIAQRVWNRTDRIVSNVPFDVRAAVALQREAPPDEETREEAQPAAADAVRTVSVS